jgi:hypothetical protein
VIVRGRQEWDAVADLPGDRILRRVHGLASWEFIDAKTGVVAWQDGDDLSIGPAGYRLTEDGVYGGGRLLIPWPRSRLKELLRPGPERHGIHLPDGSRLQFWFRKGRWLLRWSVAKILDESGETLLTLRWRAEDLHPLVFVEVWKEPTFKRLGEAVITPNRTLPLEPVLLTCYGFTAFDRLCATGGGA